MRPIRSFRIRLLHPTNTKDQALTILQQHYTQALSLLLEQAKLLDTTSRAELHRKAYHQVKAEVQLPSESLRMALNQACHIMRSWHARHKAVTSCALPTINTLQPIGIGARGYRVAKHGNRFVLRLSTNTGFLWLPLKAQSYCHAELEAIASGSLRKTDARLVKQAGWWYLLLPVSEPLSDADARGCGILGVDLGLTNLAVLSTPDGSVNQFFSGREVRTRRDRFFDRRYSLQCAKKPHVITRERNKEQRWMRDVNHKVSRAIVNKAQTLPGAVIAIEQLRGIRSQIKASTKLNRMLHCWPFGQLTSFIEYKARRAGIPVVRVDPRKTSQTCSKCGHSDRSNRISQATFRCQKCGYEIHADLQAARNIANRAQTSYGATGHIRWAS